MRRTSSIWTIRIENIWMRGCLKGAAPSGHRRPFVGPVCVVLAVFFWLGAAQADDPYISGPAFVAQVDVGAIDHRVLLIGDAGAPAPEFEPALEALRRHAAEIPDRTTVVFLGDNVYETGMPEASAIEGTPVDEILDEVLLNLYESRREAERRVNVQVTAAGESGARVVFVPGNHDWDQFGIGGWARILQLEAYLQALQAVSPAPILLLPAGGCPGPVSLDLGKTGRLIALDTQWWLDAGIGGKASPNENPTNCEYVTQAGVLTALERDVLAAQLEGREVVIAAHHPIRTNGPHGGYAPILTHFFPMRVLSTYIPSVFHWTPLPVVGSAMVAVRRFRSPSAQDLSSSEYRHMLQLFLRTFRSIAEEGRTPMLFAAGHDHSLQVFEEEDTGLRYSVVSGLGSSIKASPAGHDGYTLFAHSSSEQPGFIKLDFLKDGKVRLAVVEWFPSSKSAREVYSHYLDTQETSPRLGTARMR